ncbi:MAG TPA: cupin domain-containing protein [Candidatus Pullichristensenella stercorigallinarum]|uniref:Cupin domain-containing protein n=1 Tax=Candidatus Pullichristensenella stercorigallinarum TaxID=2840909 RepID=A0A9D1CX24_9FIRM|nr:cupin domain-containing protein [Candidatus Pullichristensenella stercorigallinarum]
MALRQDFEQVFFDNTIPVKVLVQRLSTYKLHWHPQEELIYVARGSICVHIEGETYILREGEMLYIVGDQLHSINKTDDDNLLVAIQFDADFFSMLPAIKSSAFRCSAFLQDQAETPEDFQGLRDAIRHPNLQPAVGIRGGGAPFRLRIAAEAVPGALVAGVVLAARAGHAVLIAVRGQEGQVVIGRRLARFGIQKADVRQARAVCYHQNGVALRPRLHHELPVGVACHIPLRNRRSVVENQEGRGCVHPHRIHAAEIKAVLYGSLCRRRRRISDRPRVNLLPVDPAGAGRLLASAVRGGALYKHFPFVRVRGRGAGRGDLCCIAASVPEYHVERLICRSLVVFPTQVQAHATEGVSVVSHFEFPP